MTCLLLVEELRMSVGFFFGFWAARRVAGFSSALRGRRGALVERLRESFSGFGCQTCCATRMQRCEFKLRSRGGQIVGNRKVAGGQTEETTLCFVRMNKHCNLR